MGMEVEHTSSSTQTVLTTPSSASTSGPKTSMFTKKPGFVIPKNKLSGSLVPLFRGAKKGDGDSLNEEASNRVQRKTKWGPDLTLDGTVRKGRASAYQARLNQISEQLTLGSLAVEDDQNPLSTSEFHDGKSSYHQLSQEELEMLEIEKREIIGELLKLNPSYKTPADYKPLLKEANVPIPIKEYPGYNFVGLIFGPASDTQKRLEKETGAKIRVYGSKADKGAKFEVTPTDGKEIDSSYEDLYVHVSADTFEKIDAAVTLIELLVNPVSVNPSSSSTLTTISDDSVVTGPIQSMPSSFVAPAMINQGITQPSAGSFPTQTRGHIPQYPQAWFSAGPAQTPLFPQSGLGPPINSSAALLGNPVQAYSTSTPLFFGPRSVIPASFRPVPQNSSAVPSRPQPPIVLQPPQIPMAPLLVRSEGNSAMATQNMAMFVPPRVNIPNDMISSIPAPTQSIGAPVGHPISSLSYGSAPQPQRSFSPLLPSIASELVPSSIGPIQAAMPPVAMRGPSPNIMAGPTHIPFPGTSAASFLQSGRNNSVSAAIPRPQHGSSGDFTFQPQRPQNTLSQVSLQGSQPANHNRTPPIQTGHAPLTPQSPLIRPLMNNMNPYQVQSFPRVQVGHQMNQPRPQSSTNLGGSPAALLVPPRHLSLPGHNTISSGTFQQIQPRNFNPPHVIGNPAGPFPPRAANQMNSLQQNHSPGATPQRFPTPHPHFGNYPGQPFSSGTQQIYDPFSPTTVPLNPQMGGNAAKLHNENDPEYEDLMASVGVK